MREAAEIQFLTPDHISFITKKIRNLPNRNLEMHTAWLYLRMRALPNAPFTLLTVRGALF